MKIARFINDTPTAYNKITGYNLGDSILAVCADQILNKCKISLEDIVNIPLYGHVNITDPCKMFLYGHLGRQYDMEFMKEKNVTPIFVGIGLKDSFLTDEEVEYFSVNEPVLCRDEFTRDVLRRRGVRAYLFGCISLLLSERDKDIKGNRYYIVDVNENIDLQTLSTIDNNFVYMSHMVNNTGKSKFDGYRMALERLTEYRENAKMVITSRLHCMNPCVAMGIPTIAAGKNFSFRYSYIDAFIRNYENLSCFDEKTLRNDDFVPYWIKDKMMNVIQSLFQNNPNYDAIIEIDDFYMRRDRWVYFKEIREKLTDFFNQANTDEYILWGGSSGGYAIKACVEYYFPKKKLTGVVDSSAKGIFGGLEIMNPLDMKWTVGKNIVLIATLTGKESAIGFLKNEGLTEGKDFIFVHENMN